MQILGSSLVVRDLAYYFYQFLWQQSWIPLRFKKSIYKKLCRSGELPNCPFSKSFFGLDYAGNLRDRIEFDIYYFGAFEKPLLFFLRDAIAVIKTGKQSPSSLFCDVGANIGQHSLFMSRLVSQVHSFEPYAAVSQQLERHIHLNQIRNITLHPIGLSDKTEALSFFAPSGRNQAVGSFDEASVRKGNTDIGKLPLARGDEYFQQQGIRGISLLKIDVEGFEKRVIAGLQQTLARDRPIVVCELSYEIPHSFATRADLLQLLPQDYSLLTFNTRKSDGSKARRRGARARHSGRYELIELSQWRESGQDDIVACPRELLENLPRRNKISGRWD